MITKDNLTKLNCYFQERSKVEGQLSILYRLANRPLLITEVPNWISELEGELEVLKVEITKLCKAIKGGD